MVKYSISEIAVLVKAAGLKAGIDAFDKVGCEKLADDINKHQASSPYQTAVTARYLKDTLCKAIIESADEDLIGLGQEHIETICHYLNYSSFAAFQKSYGFWKEKLTSLKPNLSNIPVLHKAIVCQLPEELQQALDKCQLEYEIIALDENAVPDDKVQNALLVIALVNDQLELTGAADACLEQWAKDTFLLFYLADTSAELNVPIQNQWKKESLVDDKDLLLILLLLELHVSGKNSSKGKAKDNERKQPFAKKVNTLIMGDNNIKAEYFSNQDMYITINKKNKK